MSKEYQIDLENKLRKKSDAIIKTLPDFAKKYFKSLRGKDNSERTIEQYALDMSSFFSWLSNQAGFKNKDLNSLKASDIFNNLTIDDINEFTDTYETIEYQKNDIKKTRKSSAAYRARRASSLRSFINYYCALGEIDTSLGKLIVVPSIKEKEIVAMEADDVNRLLDAVLDETGYDEYRLKLHKQIEKRDYALLTLGLGTGLRVSEMIGIDIDDIDFINAEIKVVRKGGDEDHVFFSQEVEDALLDYKENCRPSLLVANKKEPAFFVSNQGTRLTVRSVEKITLKYAKRAGLSDTITPHVLRKSFGTFLYRQTNDVYLVKDALHHSNIQTTVRHYTKQSDDNKRTASKVAGELFKK